MKFIELRRHLSTTHEPCYLLSGDDPFVISSALKQFERLVELPEMNLIRLNAPTASDIVNAAVVFPVMSKVRLVVVENFDKSASELKKYLLDPAPDTIIVIISALPPKNLSEILSKLVIVDCSKFDAGVIKSYIARECANAGVSITLSAADLLIESCSRSMTRISAELSKLIAYKGSGVIESDDVKKLVTADLEYKVYELGDLIVSKNGDRAMEVLYDMLSDDSGKTFGLIYSHFRKLLYISISPEDEVKSLLSINDYPYRKLKTQAKALSPRRLKAILDKLHKVDSDYKAGLINDKMAITTFAMDIINEGK